MLKVSSALYQSFHTVGFGLPKKKKNLSTIPLLELIINFPSSDSTFFQTGIGIKQPHPLKYIYFLNRSRRILRHIKNLLFLWLWHVGLVREGNLLAWCLLTINTETLQAGEEKHLERFFFSPKDDWKQILTVAMLLLEKARFKREEFGAVHG